MLFSGVTLTTVQTFEDTNENLEYEEVDILLEMQQS